MSTVVPILQHTFGDPPLIIGEGNGNPLQYSCLENPMDRGAWWAAVHGVAQSRTHLKRLSSSNSSDYFLEINSWKRKYGIRGYGHLFQ